MPGFSYTCLHCNIHFVAQSKREITAKKLFHCKSKHPEDVKEEPGQLQIAAGGNGSAGAAGSYNATTALMGKSDVKVAAPKYRPKRRRLYRRNIDPLHHSTDERMTVAVPIQGVLQSLAAVK